MSKRLRIVIADDHELVRQGVRHTLETHSEWSVVGEASNGREAVTLCQQLHPDIVVLDLTMPELTGLDAIPEILKVSPASKILALSVHDSEQLIHHVLAAGAKGYLLKSDAARDLIAAVQALSEGRVFFTARVSQALLENYLRGVHTPVAERSKLSPREREIVALVAQSKTSKEVAAILNISVRTVESHRSNIMDKLGIHSLSELIRYAIREKLIE